MEVFPVHPGAITSRPCQTQTQEALLAMCVVMSTLSSYGGVLKFLKCIAHGPKMRGHKWDHVELKGKVFSQNMSFICDN